MMIARAGRELTPAPFTDVHDWRDLAHICEKRAPRSTAAAAAARARVAARDAPNILGRVLKVEPPVSPAPR